MSQRGKNSRNLVKMKKFLIIYLLIFIVAALGGILFLKISPKLQTQMPKTPTFEEKLRPPAVAGQFYPEEKKELEKMIDDYLSKAKPPEIEGEIFGLILPHAGYIFSGPVAAYGFKAISNQNFETVIIIGDSHYERFEGVSLWPAGFWQTPLGKVEVDKDLAQKILSASERFLVRDSAHLFEHSLEVEIPFLQKTLKNFKILPIVFGSEDEDWPKLAEAILENIRGKKVLIIASSDLSHYLPYQEAQKIDEKTLEAILRGDFQNLEACGKDSIKTLMEIAKNLGAKAKLLKYANSGDTAGDKSQVVGYAALAFYLSSGAESLTRAEREELLKIAKASVESFIKTGKIPKFEVKSERLRKNQGAFVTLKKDGKLRGCIGHIVGDRPLFEVVSQMAVAAAVEDVRFLPVTEAELPELEYEISVLSPLRKVSSWQEIQIGVHGVQAVAQGRAGLFLPQVAIEQNWDLETFLEHLMLKAGLRPNYWRENPVDFYVFEAEVFGEE